VLTISLEIQKTEYFFYHTIHFSPHDYHDSLGKIFEHHGGYVLLKEVSYRLCLSPFIYTLNIHNETSLPSCHITATLSAKGLLEKVMEVIKSLQKWL
jgi:hypothetical protein